MTDERLAEDRLKEDFLKEDCLKEEHRMDDRLDPVRRLLDREGWQYAEGDKSLLFTALHGGKKWNMAVSPFGEAGICFFCAYPWKVDSGRESEVLRKLNKTNLLLRRGCLMYEPEMEQVVFRCGEQISDVYVCMSQLRETLMTCVAVFAAHWDGIGRLLQPSSCGPGLH